MSTLGQSGVGVFFFRSCGWLHLGVVLRGKGAVVPARLGFIAA
jgi:hypothetical protein